MKILHVIESGGFYGAERVLVELILGLKTLGHDSIVLSIGRMENTASALEQILTDYKIEYIPLHIDLKQSLQINRQVIACVKQRNCDLVHSHSYKSNILLALNHHRPVPFCSTLHGYVVAKRFSRMWLYQWLDKFALHYMQHVFLVSKPMLQLTSISKLKASQYSVIENGIGGYQSSQSVLDSCVLNFLHDKQHKYIAVGRLALEKGFELLIRVFAKTVKEKNSAVLVIFGDGQEKLHLQTLITELQMQKHILLYGFCSNVTHYFKHFDHFVMPSLTEGAPISLLEAMSAEMNCIATKVGAIPQMLDDGKAGYLISRNSASELEKQLKGELRHKGKEAKQQVTAHYTHLQMAKAYLSTYQNLLS